MNRNTLRALAPLLLLAAVLQLSAGCSKDGGGITDPEPPAPPPPPSQPDLLPATINLGSNGPQRAGNSLTVPAGRLSFSNSGSALARPPVRVQLCLWDGSSNVRYILWDQADITNNCLWYTGHYMYNPQFTFTFGANVPAGYYHYLVIIDPANAIGESCETNNQWVSSFTFYLSH